MLPLHWHRIGNAFPTNPFSIFIPITYRDNIPKQWHDSATVSRVVWHVVVTVQCAPPSPAPIITVNFHTHTWSAREHTMAQFSEWQNKNNGIASCDNAARVCRVPSADYSSKYLIRIMPLPWQPLLVLPLPVLRFGECDYGVSFS